MEAVVAIHRVVMAVTVTQTHDTPSPQHITGRLLEVKVNIIPTAEIATTIVVTPRAQSTAHPPVDVPRQKSIITGKPLCRGWCG